MIAAVDAMQTTSNPVKFDAGTNFEPFNHQFEARTSAGRSLEALLQWGLAKFGDSLAQVTSFGPTGMVILDHLARLSPGMRVITLDTNFLFAETYALMEEIQRRYSINLEVYRPALTPDAQAEIYGDKLWASAPDRCCFLRKVLPLQQALGGLEAWLTGLRRDQSPVRAHLPLMMWDAKYSLVKINPLAGWSRGQVWKYILQHNVPYNSLHDRGYASIGCTHCTRATTNASDERSGRWQGRQKTECGIHVA